MTVAEYIELLRQFPGDAIIMHARGESGRAPLPSAGVLLRTKWGTRDGRYEPVTRHRSCPDTYSLDPVVWTSTIDAPVPWDRLQRSVTEAASVPEDDTWTSYDDLWNRDNP